MGADVRLTWDQVLSWRLARQGLGGAAGVPSDPVGLVAHLAGVQAQVERARRARRAPGGDGAGAVPRRVRPGHARGRRPLGVTPKEARLLLADHADALVEVDVEAGSPEGVVLLPGFDPWVLAPLSHRAPTIPTGHVDDVSRKAGWISPVLLVDGRVVGTWEAPVDGGVATLTVTPLRKLPKAVVAAARRHAEATHAGMLADEVRIVV